MKKNRKKVYPNERGEFDLVIAGETQTLRYTFNALKELEKHFKAKGPQEILSGMDSWSTSDHCVFIAAGLKRGTMPDVTEEQLGDLLTFDKMKYYIETIAGAFIGQTQEEEEESGTDAEQDDPNQTTNDAAPVGSGEG